MRFFLKRLCVFFLIACFVFGGSALADGDYANENSTRGFVYRMYSIALGREPEEAGFNFWVENLESGNMKAADLVEGFLGSEEYEGLKKNNAQIVTDCYNIMLNRDPDQGGFEHWKERLNVGMTFRSVCAGFVGSTEFAELTGRYGIKPGTIGLENARDQNYERTAFVCRLYRDCLQRSPETEGLEHWCNELGHGMEGTTLAGNFAFSAEFQQKHLSNAEFVDVMYRTILGRECDNAGFSYWKEKLDYTNTREFVLNGFMGSNEFKEACAVSGIRVGNPLKTPDDTEEWQINIEMLNIVNDTRRKLGVPDLTTREDLWHDVSMVRAAEISKKQSSYRPDGRWWSTVINDTGMGYIDVNAYSDINDTVTVWENYCYGKDEPFSYWYSYSSLYNPIVSEKYESFAGAFYPEDNWEMVLFKKVK